MTKGSSLLRWRTPLLSFDLCLCSLSNVVAANAHPRFRDNCVGSGLRVFRPALKSVCSWELDESSKTLLSLCLFFSTIMFSTTKSRNETWKGYLEGLVSESLIYHPITAGVGSSAVTLVAIWSYKKYWKRIPNADAVSGRLISGRKWIKGVVTRCVGSAG
jgi:hypothetical protein